MIEQNVDFSRGDRGIFDSPLCSVFNPGALWRGGSYSGCLGPLEIALILGPERVLGREQSNTSSECC